MQTLDKMQNLDKDQQVKQCADRLEDVLNSYGPFVAIEGIIALLYDRPGLARWIASEIENRQG